MVMAVAAVAILAVAKAMEDVCVRICVGNRDEEKRESIIAHRSDIAHETREDEA